MDIEEEAFAELRDQTYSGTYTPILRSPLQKFRRKEFHQIQDIAEIFYENTKNGKLGRRNPVADISAQKFQHKDEFLYATTTSPPAYRCHDTLSLPDPCQIDVSLGEVLKRRRSTRTFTADGIDQQELSTILYYAAGQLRELDVVVHADSDDAEVPIKSGFRSYPSPGGLYGAELYVAIVHGTDQLSQGLYHYDAAKHELAILQQDEESFLDNFLDGWVTTQDITYANAAVCFLITGAFWRVNAKYGPRGHRLVLEEAGHLCQNLHLVATALGLGSVPCANYDEDQMADFMGINGVDEGIVHSLVVGVSEGESDG